MVSQKTASLSTLANESEIAIGTKLWRGVGKGEYQEWTVTRIGRKYVYITHPNGFHEVKLTYTGYEGVYERVSRRNADTFYVKSVLLERQAMQEICDIVRSLAHTRLLGGWMLFGLSEQQRKYLPDVLAKLKELKSFLDSER